MTAIGTSPAGTVAVTVSTAPLVGLDFANRNPRLQAGSVQTIGLVGDFADATGVPLPASYVTLQSSNPAVFTVSATGQITAVANGTGVLIGHQPWPCRRPPRSPWAFLPTRTQPFSSAKG